jgi:Kef-type K+ transport system membrane component KefB
LKISLLFLAALLVLVPWAMWRVRAVRHFAPLAVIQIMVGIALGPSLFGRFAPDLHAAVFTTPLIASIQGLASIGVLLFVFVSGMHLDLQRLRSETPGLASMAVGSFLLPAGFGLLLGYWVAGQMPEAVGARGSTTGFMVGFAVCIAVTALPVLAAILKELGIIATSIGQTALALAAINDAALWLVLAMLLILVADDGPSITALSALGLAWVGTMAFVVRPALAHLARVEARRAWLLPLGITVMLGAAASAEAIGIGYIIGGFAVGLVIPAAVRAALIQQIEPLTVVLLLPFFFVSAGLKAQVDPSSANFVLVVLLATAVTILGKVAGVVLPARQGGESWRGALALGILMQTKGLMEVVVLAVLYDAGLMSTSVFSALVVMAVICTLIAAPLTRALLAVRPQISRIPPNRSAKD